MNRPQARLLLVAAAAIAVTLLCLGVVAQARPSNTSVVRYVATTGSDAGPNDCLTSGSPCATIQHTIDQADPGDEIHVAGGTYAPGGTVAAITKSLIIEGGYGASFSFDPDLYPTVFDAGNNGSVVSAINSGFVFLHHLTLTNGNGSSSCVTGTGCGGGIYAQSADLHVGHCYIHHNVANPTDRGFGGGIYASGNSFVEIWGSRISNNTGTPSQATTGNGSGGGLYINSSTLLLNDCEILDNVANGRTGVDGQGGGLYLTGLISADILSNTIRGNSASPVGLNGYGSGIYLSSSSSVYMAGNLIENNHSAGGQGGGVSSNWDDIHLDRNVIISNSCAYGGGVHIRPVSPVTLSNNLIADNVSPGCCGGVYVQVNSPPPSSQLVLVNNTIVHNSLHGIGLWQDVRLDLTNNLVAFHDVGIYAYQPTIITLTADSNLFWNTSDPFTGTNAILADPLLSARYGLKEGSPALNAGVDVAWVTTDLEGNPRPPGAYDLGAFEGIRWDSFLPLTLRNH